jgi:hypothetical protein
MAKHRTTYGFGFDPKESPYHFEVEMGSLVKVIECFFSETDPSHPRDKSPVLKALLDRERWLRIEASVAKVFNQRLRAAGEHPSRWATGTTPMAPYFGKELTLLVWAVEGADFTLIPNIVANWAGLVPEERWWLYTTVNATFTAPEVGQDRGWRKAIKIAFAQNPAPSPPPDFVRQAPPLPLPGSKVERALQSAPAEQPAAPYCEGDEQSTPASPNSMAGLLHVAEGKRDDRATPPHPSAPRRRGARAQGRDAQPLLPLVSAEEAEG